MPMVTKDEVVRVPFSPYQQEQYSRIRVEEIDIEKKKDKENPSSIPAATQTAAPKEKETPASTKNTSTGSASKSSGGRAANSKKGPSATVTPGATRGFVKHANSSQGVTEPLLRQTLQTFGTVASVEMDRRKGFAYVDFAEHESLAKAIAAGPVAVGQGNVQIMERKDKKPAAVGSGNTSKDAKYAKESSTSSPAAPSTEKAEQPPKEQGSGPRRNRRGRGGGGGKGGGGGGDGKGAAAYPTGRPDIIAEGSSLGWQRSVFGLRHRKARSRRQAWAA